MKQLTKRWMVATVGLLMALSNILASQNFGQTYTWSTGSTVEYVFSAACTATMTVTNNGAGATSLSIYYGPGWAYSESYYLMPNASHDFTLTITAAGTTSIWLSDGNTNISYVVSAPGETGGGSTNNDPQPGDDPEHAYTWTAGSNNTIYANDGSRDIWYTVAVAGNSQLNIRMNYFSAGDMQGYAGIDDAKAGTNAIAINYDFEGTTYGYICQYTNTGASPVDFYIHHSGNTYGMSGMATITIESAESVNDAKSVGSLEFNLANNANVGINYNSLMLTFPDFVKGALSDYHVDVTYTVNQLTAEGYNNGAVEGYYNRIAGGTANNGVALGLPALTDGQKYQVVVSNVNVTDGNLNQPYYSGNTLTFTAVNTPDGSEGNPYIITETGVAGPKAMTTYGKWTWYKYVVPSDGIVTIYHTWSHDDIQTAGVIRVNGTQVRSSVPESWSWGCNAGDIIMMGIGTYSDASAALIRATTAAPAEGETRSTAKLLHIGSNDIARVKSGELSQWYKFNLAAVHQATLTFGAAIAAKYYVGTSATGQNITNNEDAVAELIYTNETTDATDIYVEVIGTNDYATTATLSVEEVAGGPAGGLSFTGADNGPSAAGSHVSKVETVFNLYAGAAVDHIVESKFYLQKDGSLLANPVYVGYFDNQAFAYFEGAGWTAEGTYTLVVEAGAATIGGTACDATSFSWTIGNSSSTTCDAGMATDEVRILSAKSGSNMAGAAGITTMDRDFELTCDLAGLSQYNATVGVALVMPWQGGTFDITTYIRNWTFDCDKITFSLSNDLDASLLSTAGDWKLYIYEESFLGATDDIYCLAATFTWTVVPQMTYNAPAILGATNSGEPAGSKMTMLSEDFYIQLSEPSRYAGYGIYYQFDGATDWNASLTITMSEDKTVANVNVQGADLTREGTHTIYITYGAFINAYDESKVLTTGGSFGWVLGNYQIRDVRNGSFVGYRANTDEQIDRPFFQNDFCITLSAASVATSPVVATLQKNGQSYLSQAVITGSGTEFHLSFTDWPHTTTQMPVTDENGQTIGTTEVFTYQALEPGDYTLNIAAGTFLSGSDQSDIWSGTWHVVNKVYPWSLGSSNAINGTNTTLDKKTKKLSNQFTIYFQAGVNNVSVVENLITLSYQPEVGYYSRIIGTYPTIQVGYGYADITFSNLSEMDGNGMYTLSVPSGVFRGTYTPDGASTSVEATSGAGNYTWTVENNYEFIMPECGWTSYCVDYNSQWPSGTNVYYAADINMTQVLLQPAYYHAGESDQRRAYIAAYTGLIVQGTPGEKYTVYRPIDEAYLTSFSNNQLHGVVEATPRNNINACVIAVDNSEPVFAPFMDDMIPAHSAWLEPMGAPAILQVVFSADDMNNTTTGINVNANADVNKRIINGMLIIERGGARYDIRGAKL